MPKRGAATRGPKKASRKRKARKAPKENATASARYADVRHALESEVIRLFPDARPASDYNMAGWRVGFMVGNRDLVNALARMKSYHDYGTFTPIQVASIIALEGPQDCVETVRQVYQGRRDVLWAGMNAMGWEVAKPQATMYIWAPIPEPYKAMGSLEFAKKLLLEGKVAVAPGTGFGHYGDDHVRFALIENEARTRQAIRTIKEMFRKDGLLK